MTIDNLENNLDLLNNCVIITPFSYRNYLFKLRNNNPLINFTILDKNEFLQRLFYIFDKNSLNHIISLCPSKYDLIVDIYLKLISIKDLKLDELNTVNERIKNVIKLRDYLIDIELAKKDEYFLDYLKNKKIIILGYPSDDLDFSYIKNKFNFQFEYVSLTEDKIDITKNNIKYFKFDNIFDELHFVFNECSKLIDEGVKPNNIVLVGVNSDYKFLLNYFSNIYKIPVNSNLNKTNLYSSPVVIKFLEFFQENEYQISKDIFLKDYPNNTDLLKLFEYIEPFEALSKKSLFPLIKKIAKTTSLNVIQYKDAIRIYNDELPLKDDKLFILNFTDGQFPKVHKEDSYFDDKIMKIISSCTSSSKNNLEKSLASYLLTQNNVVAVSTLTSRGDTKCFVSPLSELLKNNSKNAEPEILYCPDYEYSSEFLNIRYGIVRDYYASYKSKLFDFNYLIDLNKDHHLVNNNIQDINRFNDNSNLKLSYSSIKTYNKCHYSYYLSKILKIPELNKDDFSLKLGTIFHSVIEYFTLSKTKDYISLIKGVSSLSIDEWIKGEIDNITLNEIDNDINEYVDKLIIKTELTNIQKLLINKFVHHIKQAVKYILYRYSNMDLKLPLSPEFEVEINIDKNPNRTSIVNGKIDAYLLTRYESCYGISIIDYKTSSNYKFNENDLIDGSEVQLPTYLMFSRIDDNLKKYPFLGAYYSIVISDKTLRDDNSNIDDDFYKKVKWTGFSYAKEAKRIKELYREPKLNKQQKNELVEITDKSSYLYSIDPTWKSGGYISNVSANKEGQFSKKSVLYEEDELNEIVDKTISIYLEAFDNLRNNNFDINPKNKDTCIYCSYKHICYVNDSQFRERKEKNNE